MQDISKRKYIEDTCLIIEVKETKNGFYADPHEEYRDTMTEQQLNSLSISWVSYLANCMFTDKIDAYDNDNKKYVCYWMGVYFVYMAYYNENLCFNITVKYLYIFCI